jgi:hypothetical protein
MGWRLKYILRVSLGAMYGALALVLLEGASIDGAPAKPVRDVRRTLHPEGLIRVGH